jgi:LysM repeat protein
MDQRTRRSPARWLAPLALIAVVIAFAAIVSGSGGSGGSTSADTATTSSQQKSSDTHANKPAKTKAAGKGKARSRFYTVQVGDSLSSIATKTGVPLAKIQELNPDVDSTQMTAGQKIRIQ